MQRNTGAFTLGITGGSLLLLLSVGLPQGIASAVAIQNEGRATISSLLAGGIGVVASSALGYAMGKHTELDWPFGLGALGMAVILTPLLLVLGSEVPLRAALILGAFAAGSAALAGGFAVALMRRRALSGPANKRIEQNAEA